MTTIDDKDASAKKERFSRLGFNLIRFLSWPLAWLPPAIGLAFGACIGRLVFRLSARRRRIAIANIEMIKGNGALPPDLDAETTARESFANFGRAGWETLVFFHRGLDILLPWCQVEEGHEHLRTALDQSQAAGRGVMMVTGHMGNWELMCQYLARSFGYKMHVIGRDSGNPTVDSLIRKIRTAEGNAYIPKTGGAMTMVSALKTAGVLGTLVDQAVIADGSGVSLPFLGREATTNVGPVRLAHRTGAPIVMVLFRREGRRNFVKICPPLPPRQDMSRDEAVLADARQLNDWLSEHIRRYPDQWMWGHRRWKTREGVHQDAESIT